MYVVAKISVQFVDTFNDILVLSLPLLMVFVLKN